MAVQDVDEFAGLDEFSQEDNAEFGIGTNDLYVNWASKQNLIDGNVVSGWYIKRGRLDFDKVCEDYNEANPKNPIQLVTAAYKKDKQEEIWVLPSGFSFFVVCKGLEQAYKPELRVSAPDLGVMYVWAKEVEETEKNGIKQRRVRNQSHLHFRVIISELVEYGWCDPVQVRTKGEGKGGYTLKVLQAQQKTLTAYRAFVGKKDMPLPFYVFSIPVGRSKPTEVGKGDEAPIMILPVSLAPETPDKAYFLQHHIGKHPLADVVKQAITDSLDETIQWAKQEARKILSGGVNGDGSPEQQSSNGSAAKFGGDTEPPDMDDATPSHRQALPDDGELVTEQMRKSLRNLAVQKGMPAFKEISMKPALTKGEARQIFFESNALPDVRQN